MHCYETESLCYCGGLERDSQGNPLFKPTFRSSWTGANFKDNGKAVSVGNYGSLIESGWDFHPITDNRFFVDGEWAILWFESYLDGKLTRVLRFIEHPDCIEIIGEDNGNYCISLCDPIAIEWLTHSAWEPNEQRYLSKEELETGVLQPK